MSTDQRNTLRPYNWIAPFEAAHRRTSWTPRHPSRPHTAAPHGHPATLRGRTRSHLMDTPTPFEASHGRTSWITRHPSRPHPVAPHGHPATLRGRTPLTLRRLTRSPSRAHPTHISKPAPASVRGRPPQRGGRSSSRFGQSKSDWARQNQPIWRFPRFVQRVGTTVRTRWNWRSYALERKFVCVGTALGTRCIGYGVGEGRRSVSALLDKKKEAPGQIGSL